MLQYKNGSKAPSLKATLLRYQYYRPAAANAQFTNRPYFWLPFVDFVDKMAKTTQMFLCTISSYSFHLCVR